MLISHFATAQESIAIGSYVSTKASITNMRKGAGFDFDIMIKYKARGVPLKVRGRFEDWYKLEDFDNNKGWMHKSVVSQTAFAVSTAKIQPIFAKARVDSRIIDFIAKKTILKVIDCLEIFCLIEVANDRGWVFRKLTWGKTNGK